MAQRIGDDLVTDKAYAKLRQKWREAKTSTPWALWASHYLSPAGARERQVLRDQAAYEERRRAAVNAQIQGLADNERDERQRLDKVNALRRQANQRGVETGDYTPAALKAQQQLLAMGVPPRQRRRA